MHRHREETEVFRVYDAQVGAQQFTQAHRHSQETVYFMLNLVGQQEAWQRGTPGPPVTSNSAQQARRSSGGAPGLALLNHHRPEPIVHQVHNFSESETFRAIGVEINPTNPATVPTSPALEGLRVVWEEDLQGVPGVAARMYKIVLPPRGSTDPIGRSFDGLMTPGKLGFRVELVLTDASGSEATEKCFEETEHSSDTCRQYRLLEAGEGSLVLRNPAEEEVSVMLLQLTRTADSGVTATPAAGHAAGVPGGFGFGGCRECCCGAVGGLAERRRAPCLI